MQKVKQILNKKYLTKEDIVYLLSLNRNDAKPLFEKSTEIKNKNLGNKVFYRGLIEFSNICRKNCYYCGIRRSNKKVERFDLTDQEIIACAQYSYDNNFGSLVLQSGERNDKVFVQRITRLLKQIQKLSNGELHVTLSLGEQTEETYKQWMDAGAHRYLIRIEESNRDLYYQLHPKDDVHSFDERIKALKTLQKLGYQTGTGVMIGLPNQTIEDLANDLIFFRDFNIDMIGMGPYIEHEDTPLYQQKDKLLPLEERLFLSFKMIAILRIIMPDINIAATTAMQAIDPVGREKAIRIGANVIMPNVTPGMVRKNYLLYENKPCTDENADDCLDCLKTRLQLVGAEFAANEWGDSKHYFKRTGKQRKELK